MEPGTLILRDIHGLDAVPWWPLATGWWYLLGIVVLLVLVMFIRYWMVTTGILLGWRGDARRQLRLLKKELRHGDTRELAGRLSELLRRIALARCDRREVAGLTGDNWLHWLNEHDSSRFDWQQRGRLLLTAPYMPSGKLIERKELAALIGAASRLVDARDPRDAQAGFVQYMKQYLGQYLPRRKGGQHA